MAAWALGLTGCAVPATSTGQAAGQAAGLLAETAARVLALPPADAMLLGEQHDAPDHQQVHRQVVETLADQGRLAALAIEMAETGRSTAALPRTATSEAVRAALAWDETGWPWAAYGPAVMAAVQGGVPVLGANLPRRRMREAMGQLRLDDRLPDNALQAQRQAIRAGHCGMLPDRQIAPMTRIQVARDIAMAETIASAAVPGKVVVLLAGSGHVDRGLGVPLHLPSTLKVLSVRLLAAEAPAHAGAAPTGFDTVWVTPPVPAKDYCADMKQQMGR